MLIALGSDPADRMRGGGKLTESEGIFWLLLGSNTYIKRVRDLSLFCF